MIKARLMKSQRLEDGSVSYMLKGPGDDRAMRHAAIDLENELVEITRVQEGLIKEPDLESLDGLVEQINLLANRLRLYVAKPEPLEKPKTEPILQPMGVLESRADITADGLRPRKNKDKGRLI